VLLHGMGAPNWTTQMKAGDGRASEAKRRKSYALLARPFHSARRDEIGRQVALVLVHLQGIIMPASRMDSTNVAEVVAVLRESKANGKGILGMKILVRAVCGDQIDKTLASCWGWIAWTPSRSARRTVTSWLT